MNDFELNTTLSNLKDLLASDLSPYDAVYLGNIYCRLYEDNFLERLDDLKEGIARVKDLGLRAYITSYAAPRNDFLPKIRKALAVAASSGADAVEVHNLGVLYTVHEEFPELPVHIGGFANVYTDAGAFVLKEFGARRIMPNYELSLEEINQLIQAVDLPAELLLHGKMPLGISDYCFLLEYEERWGIKCPTLCQRDLFLKQGEWAMRSVGKGVMSGKDVCLLEHLPALFNSGHRVFRIEAAYETPAYRLEIAKVYREALNCALSDEPYVMEEEWWEIIRGHARVGLCNGFYFGKTGMDYLEAKPEAVASFLKRPVPQD
ncbi:MAG: U32 family peptidase [candidate division NC10 bacterium]|nr:U32 family peptidase [candidate division NC10 bacterium]